MWMTVQYTDVYDDEEHIRRLTVEVDEPPANTDELDEWAWDNLHCHTGDGNAISQHAGYFAGIVACPERPDLVGKEFEWC